MPNISLKFEEKIFRSSKQMIANHKRKELREELSLEQQKNCFGAITIGVRSPAVNIAQHRIALNTVKKRRTVSAAVKSKARSTALNTVQNDKIERRGL